VNRIARADVLVGAAVAAGIAITAGIAPRALGNDSSLTYVLLLVILGGMALGGYVAGREQPEVALTAGGVAALIGAAGAQALNLLYALATGKAVSLGNLVFIVFIVLLSSSFGVLGGYAAFRFAGRTDDGHHGDDGDNDNGVITTSNGDDT